MKKKTFQDISYTIDGQIWTTSKETQEKFYKETGFELACINRYTQQYRSFISKGIFKRSQKINFPYAQVLKIGEITMRFDFSNKTMELE